MIQIVINPVGCKVTLNLGIFQPIAQLNTTATTTSSKTAPQPVAIHIVGFINSSTTISILFSIFAKFLL